MAESQNTAGMARGTWFWFGILLHLVDAIFQFNRRQLMWPMLFAYLTLGFCAWFFTHGGWITYRVEGGIKSANWPILFYFLALSTIAWGLPWLQFLFYRIIPSTFTLWVDVLILFLPFFSLMYSMQGFGSSFDANIIAYYILFWITLISINFFMQLPTMDVGQVGIGMIEVMAPQLVDVKAPFMRVLELTTDTFKTGYVWLFETIPKRLSGALQEQVQYATNPTARSVEESKGVQLGVFIGSLTKFDQILYEGDTPRVYTDIRARLLDDDEEIDVKVKCMAEREPEIDVKLTGIKIEKKKYQGRVIQGEEFKIYSLITEPIDCEWEGLPAGDYKASMNINFDFYTIGYTPMFFTRKETLRQYLRDREYGQTVPVELGEAVTTFTSGPLAISLGFNRVGTLGIGDEIVPHPLTIELKNNWLGKIKKIKRFVLLVPKSFEIDQVSGISGLGKVLLMDCADLEIQYGRPVCNQETTSAYGIPMPDDEIKYSKRFRVDLQVIDVQNLVGNAPFSRKEISAVVDYEYEFGKLTDFRINKKQVGDIKTTSETIEDITGVSI